MLLEYSIFICSFSSCCVCCSFSEGYVVDVQVVVSRMTWLLLVLTWHLFQHSQLLLTNGSYMDREDWDAGTLRFLCFEQCICRLHLLYIMTCVEYYDMCCVIHCTEGRMNKWLDNDRLLRDLCLSLWRVCLIYEYAHSLTHCQCTRYQLYSPMCTVIIKPQTSRMRMTEFSVCLYLSICDKWV